MVIDLDVKSCEADLLVTCRVLNAVYSTFWTTAA